MTCKARKLVDRKIRVTCKVKLVASARVVLLRGERVVAAATGRSVTLRGLAAGRYRMLVIRGDMVVSRQVLRVG